MSNKFNSPAQALRAATDMAHDATHKLDQQAIGGDELQSKINGMLKALKECMQDTSNLDQTDLREMAGMLRKLKGKYQSLVEKPRKGIIKKAEKMADRLDGA